MREIAINLLSGILTRLQREDGYNKSINEDYVKGFQRTLLLKNVKSVSMLFGGCLALILCVSLAMPLFTGKDSASTEVAQAGNETISNVAKFAKVEKNTSTSKLPTANDGKYQKIDLSGEYKSSAGEGTDGTEEDTGTTGDAQFMAKTNCLANIRKEPRNGDNIIGQKQPGEEVEVLGTEGEYYKILHNQETAYIHNSCFE